MKNRLSLVISCIMILAMMLPTYAENIVAEDIATDDVSAVEIVSDEQIAADEIQADTIDDTANEAITTDEVTVENNVNGTIYRYTVSLDDSAYPGIALDVACIGIIENGVKVPHTGYGYNLIMCYCGAWYDDSAHLINHIDSDGPSLLHSGPKWLYTGTYHAKISADNPLKLKDSSKYVNVIVSRPEGYIVEYSTDDGTTYHRSFWLSPGFPDETTLNDEPATTIHVSFEELQTNHLTLRLKKLNTTDNTEKISEFVERLYTKALGRQSEAEGKENWVKYLKSGKMTGAEAGKAFMMGEEFKNRNLSNEEFLNTVYQTYYGREPDTSGYNAWLNYLNNGYSRDGVICQFACGKEFQEICSNYGMKRGTIISTENRDKNFTLTSFVNRIYTKLLDRNAEPSGLNAWTGAILNNEFTVKQTAVIFVESKEFLAHNYSTEDFVTHLYRMFFGREPEPEGLKKWVDYINADKISRTGAAEAFADSIEFAAIMKDAGIDTLQAHTHNWETKTIHHDAAGHEEPFYETHKKIVCNKCGRVFDNATTWEEHSYLTYPEGCPSTNYKYVDQTMEAGSRLIVETPAWDETYQECSVCHLIK